MPDLSRSQLRALRTDAREVQPPDMIVWHLPDTERAKLLLARYSFYEGCQHNHCKLDFGGMRREPGEAYLNARLKEKGIIYTNAAQTDNWSDRKPDTPHSLGRQVVERFTDLLVGEVCRPMLKCPADDNTEAYIAQIMKSSQSWASLQQARDYKGAMASAAIVLGVVNGKPTSEAIKTCHLWVQEWEAEPNWVPRVVLEQKLVSLQVPDDDEPGTLIVKQMWQTRVWDDTHLYIYKDVPEDWDDKEEMRPIPIDEIIEHKAGRCPVIWMQNTRDTESPEGNEDFKGVYEQSDRVDRVRSFSTRATIANTDPTLAYKDSDRNRRRNPMSRKGHGARIDLSPEGDAKLLETSGSSVEMAWGTEQKLRSDILQTVRCVILDPESITAFKSGEALLILWRAMEARASRLRIPLGDEIGQIAVTWATLGRNWGVTSTETPETDGIILPPRVIKEGDGEKEILSVHDPGNGRYIDVQWGVFHTPTATQLQALIGALTTANGAKPILSQQTTTEIIAAILGLDSPDDENRRLREEREQAMKEMEQAMGDGSPPPGMDKAGDRALAKDRDQASKATAKAGDRAASAEKKTEKPKNKGETD